MSDHTNTNNHIVPIRIDKTNLKTPTPTTGVALYLLGTVGSEYDLWLEVPGPAEDEFISNDDAEVNVKPGDHFFTVKKTLNPGNV